MPLVISWGYDSDAPSHSQFLDYMQWQGTNDLSSYLTIPDTIKFLAIKFELVSCVLPDKISLPITIIPADKVVISLNHQINCIYPINYLNKYYCRINK